MYAVAISEKATADIREIFEYIAYTLHSPVNAEKQLNKFYKSIKGLEQMPERFPLVPNETCRNRNIRFNAVDNYTIFYIVDNKNLTVTILHIFYSGRNIDLLLSDL
ncbi:MAG: type II toxin-antitoxin system RelE/ParE family toxin [Firmicutes bacterium]|nr:type II toxin-antitoxin system RelE/ParE family toxin [Bacillota bacterium]